VTAKGGINLHGSLLPEYRGAAPIQWAILDGKQQTGVTVIHMTPRLDGGPCLVQLTTPIGEDEEAVELEQRLARLGIDAVRQALPMLESWDGVSPIGVPQDRTRATKAPRLRKQDGWVDWRRTAKQIRDQVRALKPWPTTFTDWLRPEGAPVRLILERVRVVEAQVPDATTAGQIVQVEKEQVLVATGQHLLSLEQVQPAGKRVMTIGEFLRGHSMQAGQLLGRVIMPSWQSVEGAAFPLGATWIAAEEAFNFALYSKHATSVTLLLYAEDDVETPVLVYPFHHLRNKSGRIWHCRIPRARMGGAKYYAYRVDGPKTNGQYDMHAFDAEKILLDPYASSVFFPETFDRDAAMRPGPNDGHAPLGVLHQHQPPFDWGGEVPYAGFPRT
jgi:methionyl-tRNA formyltransferase